MRRHVKHKKAKPRARARKSLPRILICTPEVTELPEGLGNAANFIRAKGGGLGDISAGLIQYLHRDGRFEVHVAVPKYDTKILDLGNISIREMDHLGPALHGMGIHLVTDAAFSHLTDVYGDNDAHPRVRRAEAFQRHIINNVLDEVDPAVVHCNDWMTALVPAAARARGIKSLFTLHNVFSEKDTPENVYRSGIDVSRFMDWLYFEHWPEDSHENWCHNRIDFTASGIHGADLVNTVSPSFLEEIVRGDFSDIIPESVRQAVRIKHEAGAALGFLNGPSDSADPRVSPYIVNYDVETATKKKRLNKKELQLRMGLRQNPDAPLFFFPSRLYPQKGPELLWPIIRRCVDKYKAQFALVANGDPGIVRHFRVLEPPYRASISHRPFSEDLSTLAKAGADFILMPSKYEPCGLPQMEGPRFGTLPVARLTGGLRDTVTEIDLDNETGNGFVFAEHTTKGLEEAISRAVRFYARSREVKRRVIQRVMRESVEKFTLAKTAQAYIDIYDQLIASR